MTHDSYENTNSIYKSLESHYESLGCMRRALSQAEPSQVEKPPRTQSEHVFALPLRAHTSQYPTRAPWGVTMDHGLQTPFGGQVAMRGRDDKEEPAQAAPTAILGDPSSASR